MKELEPRYISIHKLRMAFMYNSSINWNFCCAINPIQWQNNENHQEQVVYKKTGNPSQIPPIPLLLPNTTICISQAFPISMLKEMYILWAILPQEPIPLFHHIL